MPRTLEPAQLLSTLSNNEVTGAVIMKLTLRLILPLLTVLMTQLAAAAGEVVAVSHGDYRLSAGDSIRVFVYQNADLMFEARVAESGEITYPLIGAINVGGLTLGEAEAKIAGALKDGGYVQRPQVHIVIETVGGEVSVLGQVGHPGPFLLRKVGTHLSEVLANAGAVVGGVPGAGQGGSAGADTVIVTGERNQQAFRRVIDLPDIFSSEHDEDDIVVEAGDVVYVPPAPVYYIYGQVQRPGAYTIARQMTVEQAMAQAGGPTVGGSEGRLRLDRRDSRGAIESTRPAANDLVKPDDVLYVPVSIF
jgi:polysaccharide export outer membrane protein